MKEESVARLTVGNKDIWDYRNMRLRDRIRISISLILTGIVDISWEKQNEKEIDVGKKANPWVDESINGKTRNN